MLSRINYFVREKDEKGNDIFGQDAARHLWGRIQATQDPTAIDLKDVEMANIFHYLLSSDQVQKLGALTKKLEKGKTQKAQQLECEGASITAPTDRL